MTKAAARSVSTIRKASALSLAGMMVAPRLRATLASVTCLMLVVPAVDTTVLPFSSSACTCPAQSAAANARPKIRNCFIRLLLQSGCQPNACINRAELTWRRSAPDVKWPGIAKIHAAAQIIATNQLSSSLLKAAAPSRDHALRRGTGLPYGKQRRQAKYRDAGQIVARRHVADHGDGAERGHDRRPHAAEDRDTGVVAQP